MTNDTLLNIAIELVRRAYKAIIASNQDKILSPGGVITASKTYLKSAIIVLRELDPHEDMDLEKVLELSKMLREISETSTKKLEKFNVKDRVVQKRLSDVRRTARWVLSTLEKKISLEEEIPA